MKAQLDVSQFTLKDLVRKRLMLAQTNCLSEPLFGRALEQAQYLDKYFSETGKLIGPLHGVPVSVKDQFNVEGVDTTLGYVGRSFKPAQTEAVLVRILKSLGAIVIAKTSIPQSILVRTYETLDLTS